MSGINKLLRAVDSGIGVPMVAWVVRVVKRNTTTLEEIDEYCPKRVRSVIEGAAWPLWHRP
jgi:hypothetical protein